MNIWMDIAIPALVTCAALAVLAIWAFLRRKECEALCTHVQQQNIELFNSKAKLREERDGLVAQAQQQNNYAIAQAQRVVDALQERDTLQLQLDEALKPKPTRTPRSNSRAKPPAQE